MIRGTLTYQNGRWAIDSGDGFPLELHAGDVFDLEAPDGHMTTTRIEFAHGHGAKWYTTDDIPLRHGLRATFDAGNSGRLPL